MTKTMRIKPKDIFEVMDMAKLINSQGELYNPCFAGDSGIGKSKIVQQWTKAQGKKFGFVDLRLAYMDGPDVIGMPTTVTVNGVTKSIHALPEFLPTEGEGLIFFEEPNRAHPSTMQTIMQILTDGKIHKWEKPAGWLIAAAINPEDRYNVNNMDAAVKNRFAMYDVVFDQNAFVTYMKEHKFDSRLISFVESGLWVYKSLDELPDNEFYVSGRSLERLNHLLKNKVEDSKIAVEFMASVVGKTFALDFNKFVNEIRPLTFEDFKKNKKQALTKLKAQADKPEYKGDLTSITVNSLIDAYKAVKCKIDLIAQVAAIIEKDQATNLLASCIENTDAENLTKFVEQHRDLMLPLKERFADLELAK
jgi:hypothetical protein